MRPNHNLLLCCLFVCLFFSHPNKMSVPHRYRCSCAVVDGYRCGNEGGPLQVKGLHAHLGIAAELVKEKK